jgi:hypothetical protein
MLRPTSRVGAREDYMGFGTPKKPTPTMALEGL